MGFDIYTKIILVLFPNWRIYIFFSPVPQSRAKVETV